MVNTKVPLDYVENKKVTVYVPVYNAEKYLTETLESILAQTYDSFDIYLVDDASTDSSRSIIERYIEKDSRVVGIFHDENGGEAKRRNEALQIVRTPYLAFCDADDLMPASRIEKQVTYLEKNVNCDVIFGGYQKISETGEEIDLPYVKEWSTQEVYGNLLFQNMIPIGSTMLRLESIRKNELQFDESLITLCDYCFWLDCAKKGISFVGVDEIMQFYRIVNTGLSISNSYGEKLNVRNRCFDELRYRYLKYNRADLNVKQAGVICKYIREGNVSKVQRIMDLPQYLKIWKAFRKSQLWDNQFFRDAFREFIKRYYHI